MPSSFSSLCQPLFTTQQNTKRRQHSYNETKPPFHDLFTLPILATFLKQAFLAYLQLALNYENNLNQFTLKQLFEVISSSFSNFLWTHGLKSLAAKTQSHQKTLIKPPRKLKPLSLI